MVTILYFAAAREAAGTDRETWPDAPRDVAALRVALLEREQGF